MAQTRYGDKARVSDLAPAQVSEPAEPAKPTSVIAQVEGSGTAGAKPVVVALPILNADKKPDVNRVAFVSMAI